MKKILLIFSAISILMVLAIGYNNKQKEAIQPSATTESAITTMTSVETSTEQAVTTEQSIAETKIN